MRTPRLSIVTPTRNAPHLMDRLFDSLLRQTCPDFEYVLVDTSADDRTEERWWRDFAPHLDHRFRYARVHLPSPNMAAAFEYAFAQARGEYVCPMTHKAMWRPDGVEDLHRILDHHPELPCFAFISKYTQVDIHTEQGIFPNIKQYNFGSGWDYSPPTVFNSRELFEDSLRLFGEYGYGGPHVERHNEMPFACHAIYSRKLLDRVLERFGTLVEGKFAGDSRLGYRVMDLVEYVHLFQGFEPRISSMHGNTGAAGSQLTSWVYLRNVFNTLSTETKQIISRSPFGYLPLWSVMTYWELFSVTQEACGNLVMTIEYPTSQVARILQTEIARLQDIEEPVRAGLLSHVDAIADRLDGGVLRSWF